MAELLNAREWARMFVGGPPPPRPNLWSSPKRFAKRLVKFSNHIVLPIITCYLSSPGFSCKDDRLDCLWILGHAGNLALPLPRAIDERAHANTLGELHYPEMLTKLLHIRSGVCSNVTTRFGILREQLSQMITINADLIYRL